MPYELTDVDRTILDLEQTRWKYAGAKDQAIHDALAITPTRYYQILNHLIDRPEALAAEPALVKRLLRLRQQRRAATRPLTTYRD